MRKNFTEILRWFFLMGILAGMIVLFLQAREMTSRPERLAQIEGVFVR